MKGEIQAIHEMYNNIKCKKVVVMMVSVDEIDFDNNTHLGPVVLEQIKED